MEQRERIDYLVDTLNKASEAYYGGEEERMTNFEWDQLFDELTELEGQTGYIRPDSPTQTTSHAESEPDAAGEKEPHEYPALSLAKTKDVAELQKWAGDRAVWLSWKLDGLTLVLTYDGGQLVKILTRGNGTIGSNITYMKEALVGVPLTVDEPGHLVVRGEATISYTDFERINRYAGTGQDQPGQGQGAPGYLQRFYAGAHRPGDPVLGGPDGLAGQAGVHYGGTAAHRCGRAAGCNPAFYR